jgi:hypothetical protein
LAILRDAEHRKNPLKPAPHPDDDEKAIKSDDESDDEGEEGDSVSMDNSSVGGKEKRENMVEKISHAGMKGKRGTKIKARKAWDRLGKAKEEVRKLKWLRLFADVKGFAILAGHKQLDVQGRAEVSRYSVLTTQVVLMGQHLLDKLHISKDHKIVSTALDHLPSPPPTIHGDTASSMFRSTWSCNI